MGIEEQFKTIKERVEWILKNYPEARNNDFYLYLLYLRNFERELSKYIKYIPFGLIKSATPFESVRRARQLIQNTEGKYPPTDPEVIRRRRIKEKAMRKMFAELKR